MLLKKKKSTLWVEWIATAFSALVLFLAAGTEPAVDCDLADNPHPLIEHGLSTNVSATVSYGMGKPTGTSIPVDPDGKPERADNCLTKSAVA